MEFVMFLVMVAGSVIPLALIAAALVMLYRIMRSLEKIEQHLREDRGIR